MNFGSLDSLDERAGASVPLRDAEAYDTSVQAVALQGCQLIPLRCTSGAFRRSIFLWSFRFSSSANRRSDLQFAKSTDVVWAHHCERPNVPNGRTADLFIFPRRCGQSILFFDVYFFSCFRDSLFLVLARPKLLPPPPKKKQLSVSSVGLRCLEEPQNKKKKGICCGSDHSPKSTYARSLVDRWAGKFFSRPIRNPVGGRRNGCDSRSTN